MTEHNWSNELKIKFLIKFPSFWHQTCHIFHVTMIFIGSDWHWHAMMLLQECLDDGPLCAGGPFFTQSFGMSICTSWNVKNAHVHVFVQLIAARISRPMPRSYACVQREYSLHVREELLLSCQHCPEQNIFTSEVFERVISK